MRPFLQGFASELIKTGGIGGAALRLVAKHPMAALSLGLTGLTAGHAAAEGYKGGLEGGEQGHYLNASKLGPSEAFETNYHPLFEHRLSPHGERALSRSYNPAAFKE